MGSHAVVEPARDLLERLLEGGIGERLDPAAVVADEVMVMFSARMGGLEAGDSVTELDTLDEVELDELVEGAVDACDPDPATLPADSVEELLCRLAAGLRPEVLDDGSACPSVAESLRL